MISDEAAFEQAILDDPNNDIPRLAYAGWLEKRSYPCRDPRSEYLRLEVALTGKSGSTGDDETRRGYARLYRLRMSIDPPWLDSIGKRYDLVLVSYDIEAKVHVIRWVRELTGNGLAATKTLVETTPCLVLSRVPFSRAARGEYVIVTFPEERLRYIRSLPPIPVVELRVSANEGA